MPPVETMTHDAFHAHLDACPQCERNPFGLCADGDRLLLETAATIGSNLQRPATFSSPVAPAEMLADMDALTAPYLVRRHPVCGAWCVLSREPEDWSVSAPTRFPGEEGRVWIILACDSEVMAAWHAEQHARTFWASRRLPLALEPLPIDGREDWEEVRRYGL